MSLNASPYIIREAVPSDAEGTAYVHVKAWQTSYGGMIEQSYLDNINYDQRLELRKKILYSEGTLQLIVIFGEQIIGFADAGPLRPQPYNEQFFPSQEANVKYGEIFAIYLLAEHQRKGLGKKLYQECRQWFKAQSYDHFVTWGLANNTRARRFYESEGGELIGETIVNIGGKEYKENCYLFET
jgi:GNAT superfamily N-acetyltransferase